MRFTRRVHAVRRHWLVASAIVLLVAAAGAGGWLLFRPDGASAQARTATSSVTASTVKQTVSADGTVNPTRTDTLTFPGGGTVTSVLVSVGDKVAKGDVVARMDATALTASRDAAQATLDSAEAQYSEDVDADAGATQVASDNAQIVSARSSLSTAQSDVDDATMRAPFSGRVSAVGYAVDDSTGSSSASGGGTAGGTSASTSSPTTSSASSTTGITVISTGSYQVAATVDSTDLAQLKTGQQAAITPTGSTTPVYGVVESIGVVASTSGDSTTTSTSTSASFPVTIKVTGSTAGLYAGSSATVSITVKQVSNALTVPTQALSTKAGRTYVTLVEDGKHSRHYVTVGDTYGNSTVVTKGVSSGDKVLIAGFTPPTSRGSGSGQQSRTGNGGGFGGPPTGTGGTGGFGGGQ